MMTRLSVKKLRDNNYTRPIRNIPVVNYAGMDDEENYYTDPNYVPDNNVPDNNFITFRRRSPRNLKRVNYYGMDE